jgi:hypothetical protein
MRKQEFVPRYAAQIKLGRGILSRIDYHRQREGVSRNQWIQEAIARHIERGRAIPYRFTAEWLLSRKSNVMMRLDGLTLSLMNEACMDQRIPRTVFLLDALLSRLAEDKKKLAS